MNPMENLPGYSKIRLSKLRKDNSEAFGALQDEFELDRRHLSQILEIFVKGETYYRRFHSCAARTEDGYWEGGEWVQTCVFINAERAQEGLGPIEWSSEPES